MSSQKKNSTLEYHLKFIIIAKSPNEKCILRKKNPHYRKIVNRSTHEEHQPKSDTKPSIYTNFQSYTTYTITNRNRIIESKSSKSQNRGGTHTFFGAMHQEDMHREDFDTGHAPDRISISAINERSYQQIDVEWSEWRSSTSSRGRRLREHRAILSLTSSHQKDDGNEKTKTRLSLPRTLKRITNWHVRLKDVRPNFLIKNYAARHLTFLFLFFSDPKKVKYGLQIWR